VFKGRRKHTGQITAMKFIGKHGKSEKDINALRQEIEILRQLRHENIIQMLDTFETDADFVVVMEFAQGAAAASSRAAPCHPHVAGADGHITVDQRAAQRVCHVRSSCFSAPKCDSFSKGGEQLRSSAGELFEILEDDKQLPEAVVQDVAKQLVRALYYLHNNRIIHRDMKPQVPR